jgi:hypothetical protein
MNQYEIDRQRHRQSSSRARCGDPFDGDRGGASAKEVATILAGKQQERAGSQGAHLSTPAPHPDGRRSSRGRGSRQAVSGGGQRSRGMVGAQHSTVVAVQQGLKQPTCPPPRPGSSGQPALPAAGPWRRPGQPFRIDENGRSQPLIVNPDSQPVDLPF